MKKKILWLVIARAGSKSVVDKNVKILGNYPLLAYRIKAALGTRQSNDIWISTDSESYGEIAMKYGADMPFLRPEKLATDQASSVDVVLQAMNFAMTLPVRYDYVGLLEPTSPFISANQLEEAISRIENNEEASSIVAVKESRPNKIFVQDDNIFLAELSNNLRSIKNLGRQSFVKQITPSGGFYISRWNDFMNNKTFYSENTLSFEVDEISGLEIDDPIDWLFATFILEKNLLDVNKLFKYYESGI